MRLELEQTLATLRRDGLSVHENFLDAARLAEIRTEFERCIEGGQPGTIPVDHPPGAAFLMRLDDPQLGEENRRKSKLAAAFDTAFLRHLALAYLPEAAFCARLMGTYDFRAVPVTGVHFDTFRSLKFMLYLQDTDKDNGAFSYLHGSHVKHTRFRRMYNLLGGVLLEIPNGVAPEFRAQLSHIEAPAGTLIIFDADGLHAGGVIRSGKSRRIVRAHCITERIERPGLARVMPYRLQHSSVSPANLYSRLAMRRYLPTRAMARLPAQQ